MDEPIRLRRPEDGEPVETLYICPYGQVLQVGEQGIKAVNGQIIEQWGEGPYEFYDAGGGIFRARLKDV